jgi:hypothetical protein
MKSAPAKTHLLQEYDDPVNTRYPSRASSYGHHSPGYTSTSELSAPFISPTTTLEAWPGSAMAVPASSNGTSPAASSTLGVPDEAVPSYVTSSLPASVAGPAVTLPHRVHMVSSGSSAGSARAAAGESLLCLPYRPQPSLLIALRSSISAAAYVRADGRHVRASTAAPGNTAGMGCIRGILHILSSDVRLAPCLLWTGSHQHHFNLSFQYFNHDLQANTTRRDWQVSFAALWQR